jgi:HAD superfamily hydrolase (TIGR01509 family)
LSRSLPLSDGLMATGRPERRSMIEAVVFDWGGTLTPIPEVDLVEVWRSAARQLGADRTDELTTALHAAERAIWDATIEDCRSGRVVDVVRTATASCGLSVADDVVAAAVTTYLAEWVPYSAAHPEAVKVLETVRSLGFRTGLLSNTHWPREWHEERLVHDGLAELLDAAVFTSDLEYRKPHAEAFGAVLDALDVRADRAVFVGDRMHDDMYGANAIGMRTIWIRNASWESWDVEPEAVVDSLAEVVGVVERWSAGD